MNFEKNLPFPFLKRVFFPKALPYLFSSWERCLQIQKGKIYVPEVLILLVAVPITANRIHCLTIFKTA
ncbi:MAG: hypothetical protein LBU84_00670 [Prevotella sp.]|jgi:hypothetical protein|nr:hypothetical protein [Prevotella sp.]